MFPARRGDANRNLRPEELATVMDAEYRRKLLRLLAIRPEPGEAQPTPILLLNKGVYYRAALLKVDPDHGVAYFKAHAPRGSWPILNRGELAVLYSFVFLYIACQGDGRWSATGLFRRLRVEPKSTRATAP